MWIQLTMKSTTAHSQMLELYYFKQYRRRPVYISITANVLLAVNYRLFPNDPNLILYTVCQPVFVCDKEHTPLVLFKKEQKFLHSLNASL